MAKGRRCRACDKAIRHAISCGSKPGKRLHALLKEAGHDTAVDSRFVKGRL